MIPPECWAESVRISSGRRIGSEVEGDVDHVNEPAGCCTPRHSGGPHVYARRMSLSTASHLQDTIPARKSDRDGPPTRARAIRALGDAAKLNRRGRKKVAPHDLRHSCAGLLLAAGVSPPKVAAILRHADTRTTLTVYAGLVESQRVELRTDLEAALSAPVDARRAT